VLYHPLVEWLGGNKFFGRPFVNQKVENIRRGNAQQHTFYLLCSLCT
jgi:hypothetical protein